VLLESIAVANTVCVFAAVLLLGLVAATNYQIHNARPIAELQAAAWRRGIIIFS
jgi:hypothetical protein